MKSVQKSLRLALVAAIALVASASQSQAASPFVFGKEPVARHNRAVLARRAQASSSYRMSYQQPATRYYGGTAMVQTYPAPSAQRSSAPVATRYYVTPAGGYRTRTAVNSAYYVR